MSTTRAAKGGQYGKNNEWYQGGQFLPSSENTEKGLNGREKANYQDKPRKQEIAPYKWEVSTQKSLWTACFVGGASFFTKTGYSKETGAQGYLTFNDDFNWQAAGWSSEAIEETKAYIERWNNGERWV